MIFNTSTSFNVEMKDIKYIPGGIHENVSLIGARFDKSPNGNSFIEFNFGKDGATLKHTEYEPSRYNDQSDAELQAKVDGQISRIMQIMKCFYTKEQLNYTADSFSTFANWVVALVNSADKSNLVRIKSVYNQNGFTSLPRYSKYTFIEPMSIEKNNSKIVELGIDVFERPAIADKEKATSTANEVFSSSNSYSSGSVAGESKGEMPF